MDVDNQSEDGEIKKSPKDMDEFSFSEEEGGDTADSLDIKPPQAATRVYKSSSSSSRRRDKHNDRRDRRSDDNKERKSSRYYDREERHRDKHKHRSRHSGGIDGLDRSERSDRSDLSKRDQRDRMERIDRVDTHSRDRDSSSRHDRKDRTTGDRVLEDLRTRLLDKRRERRDDPRDIRGIKTESRRDMMIDDGGREQREIRELRESREMLIMRENNRRDMRIEDVRDRRSGGIVSGDIRIVNDDVRERRDVRIDERRHGQQINDEQQQQQQHYMETDIMMDQSIDKQRQEKRHKKNHKHDKIRDREKSEREHEREHDREHREKQLREVMEIIPSDEIESMDIMGVQMTHHLKDPKEMTEQELRRDRLLEADREKARRREVSRLELEARRLKRGEKRSHSPEADVDSSVVELSDGSIRSRQSDDDDGRLISPKSNGRHSSDNHNSDQERSSDNHTSDSSSSQSDDDDDDDDEDEDDNNNDDDDENLDNNSNDSDKTSVDGSNVDSDYNNPSPISVDRLAKSDHSDGDSPGHIESNGVSQNTTLVDDLSVDENNHDDNKKQQKKDDNNDDTEKKSLKENDNGIDLPPYLPAIQGCRSVEEFQCLNRIEEGTYGVVYRARCKRTNEIVALKRLKMEKEKEGFPITSLREINTLLKAQHENIVTVREIVVGSNMDRIFIVMDYVEHDLKSLMETMKQKKQVFIPGEVKCLMQQLLKAVLHLHDNWILHRDLKTSNLLLSHRGILKVGDFGLAREYGSPLRQYTPVVVTLWYRAPELLLNYKEYSTPIDMWSVGCIFAELLRMDALFPGRTEMDQLQRIFKELGTPNDKTLPGYSQLPIVQTLKIPVYHKKDLKQRFSTVSKNGTDLLTELLKYDPEKRSTASLALKHDYFKETPLPINPNMFPTWPAKSELGAKTANASPKPPSGGREFKQLGDGDEPVELNSSGGFHMGATEGGRPPPIGGGFHLKF
ncbi:hypothetical protein HCN44_004016 [Aphidius gifuensis]|uniref:cyclin-dependent kinase n=1 Tax=Aphidius gifuensis TaxID=684658 RepID=A0A835CS30_APHGI|nr:serine/threonine-protein kinase PITSLRE-like isoform X2 [Aphidius gifuensis]KAF7994544.1 hypothetical protein HCN44_004016 [Aphidius gifuensis]